jgi:metal-responsive CopG/Arc/MetJ family transcriptional regulator
MTTPTPNTTVIDLVLPAKLLAQFDATCLAEYGEPGKRSLKLRSLMRAYIEKSGV